MPSREWCGEGHPVASTFIPYTDSYLLQGALGAGRGASLIQEFTLRNLSGGSLSAFCPKEIIRDAVNDPSTKKVVRTFFLVSTVWEQRKHQTPGICSNKLGPS